MDRYPIPPGDSVEPIVNALKDARRQLRDVQRPGGTGLTQSVPSMPRSFSYFEASSGFIIPGTIYADVVTLSVDVPDGFTTAQLFITFSLKGQNLLPVATYAGKSYAYARVRIDGTLAPTSGFSSPTQNGDLGNAHTTYATTLNGLAAGSRIELAGAGSAFTFGAAVQPAWNTTSSNSAELAVSVIFLP